MTSPQCGSEWMKFYACFDDTTSDCTALNQNCVPAFSYGSKCEQCGPPDASPKPGDACLATQEGEKRCWYCDVVMDCRFEDGFFIWRVFENCPMSCKDDSTGVHC